MNVTLFLIVLAICVTLAHIVWSQIPLWLAVFVISIVLLLQNIR